MVNYSKHFNTVKTPQSEPIPGEQQVQNSAGGYTYALDCWGQLDRFLILGSEGNTYYATEHEMTVDNAKNVVACIKQDGLRAVKQIVEISESGRAPKNDAAIFALAMASVFGDTPTRKNALNNLAAVCHIPTHLFAFVEARQALGGGWGRTMREAVGYWYNAKKLDSLAFTVMKYKQRNGWSHRDLLRLAHPMTEDGKRNAVYAYLVGKPVEGELPPIIEAVNRAQKLSIKELPQFIVDNKLTREMIPTEALNNPEVWEALLQTMPPTALLRNLGKLTAVGTLTPLSDASRLVMEKIKNHESLVKARVHPIAVLSALKVYEQGHGERGKLTWTAVPAVVDALNDAFYGTFRSVDPTGKRLLLGVDVSGSMGMGSIAGVPGLTPAVCAAAMALVIANTEHEYYIHGFAEDFVDLKITPKMRLDDVLRRTTRMNFGRTDCALPMLYALKHKLNADAFVILTDNETWVGHIHPQQALKQYRDKMKLQARSIVVGMTATQFTIADPKDLHSLDIVGFDAAAPAIIGDFIRG